MRVVIYARYSTDKQKPVSIAVQNENTRAFLAKQGWTEVGAYADEAITGRVIKLRPGMTELLQSVERGGIDLVLADELDRLSRSQWQTPMIFERLEFLGIRLHTIAEGEITRLHVGLKGTMNAEQLAATSRKTRDALAKRFRDGQNPGGLAYGYALDFVLDARGDRIPGHRRIVSEQAETVVYICEQYAGGRSPHDIAIELNDRGVPGPRGGHWSPSTINGNKARGTGILNNQLYIGQPEHQRQTYRRDPETGARRAFRNPDDLKQHASVPHLRILSDELWQRVKARQAVVARSKDEDSDARPFWAKQRPRYLLTGKIVCGECGSTYSKNGKFRSACHAATKKGASACTNRLTVRIDALEEQVLAALRDDMMRPETVEAFIAEYIAERNRLANRRDAAREDREAELREVTAGVARLTAAILKGVDPSLFADDLNRMGRRKLELERELAKTTPETSPALLHPRLAQVYRRKVERLLEAFEDEGARQEAQEIIRSLIDAVVMTPVDGALQAEVKGDLATMLVLASETRRAPEAQASEARQVKMVAGTGFEPVTFRL